MYRYTNAEELPMMLTLSQVSRVLGVSRSMAYQLAHSRTGFPVLRIGARMLVPKDKLLAWIDRQLEH